MKEMNAAILGQEDIPVAAIDVTETNITENKEENTMKRIDLINREEIEKIAQAMAQDAQDFIQGVTHTAKVVLGETKEEYVSRVDDAASIVIGTLTGLIKQVGTVLGFTGLQISLINILKAGETGKKNKKSFGKMAAQCRAEVDAYEEYLRNIGEEGQAKKLRELFHDMKGKSVFTVAFAMLSVLAKKATKKLRKWFGVDKEESIIGGFFRSLAGIATFIRETIHLVWETGKFIASFAVAGILKLCNAIKSVAVTIKDWVVAKFEKLTNKDVEDDFDDDIIDDDVVNDDVVEA